MVDTSTLLSFIGVSLLLSLTPGPDNLFVITQSASKGAKTGIWISVGLCLGIIVHTTLAATGVGVLIQKSPTASRLLGFVGAGYLFYLAWQTIQQHTKKAQHNEPKNTIEAPVGVWRLLCKGFTLNVLNPKVTLFFIAFLPAFIKTENGNPMAQMLFLGMAFMLQALLCFSFFALLASNLQRLKHARIQHYSPWLEVLLYIGIGIWITM